MSSIIDIRESETEYTQLNTSAIAKDDDRNEIPNENKGCIKRCHEYLKRAILHPFLRWYKCNWTGKIFASILQTVVIGDVISDLVYFKNLAEYNHGWWVFISFLIFYLSLRFTLVFTVT